ncbi:MAG TPA: septum site-determining protein MinC [Solimonas sp.]|nr:septum site-determining protein MinC [Solimonas sp.]
MSSAKALEFKGRMLSLTRVRVLDPDPVAIEAQLQEFARQMPSAVHGMPVVLESDMSLDVGGILSILRNVGMQPLGVTEGPLAESARAWGLPVLAPETGKGPVRGSAAKAQAPPSSAATPPAATSAPAAAVRKATRIVTEPVRGGQQVYAQDGDLIVLNMVAAGAEVIADGCVHVYNRLTGRAVAGAKGDVTARIFCKRFEAELVAVAGVYAVAEQMHGDLRGKPVQAWLQNGKLKMERMDW